MPPLTLSHSTSTVPLKRARSAGVSDTIRVVKSAAPDGVTLHRPPGLSLAAETVGRRRPGDEEFLGNITDAGYVEGAQQECGFPGRRCGRNRNSADRHVRIITPPALWPV